MFRPVYVNSGNVDVNIHVTPTITLQMKQRIQICYTYEHLQYALNHVTSFTWYNYQRVILRILNANRKPVRWVFNKPFEYIPRTRRNRKTDKTVDPGSVQRTYEVLLSCMYVRTRNGLEMLAAMSLVRDLVTMSSGWRCV